MPPLLAPTAPTAPTALSVSGAAEPDGGDPVRAPIAHPQPDGGTGSPAADEPPFTELQARRLGPVRRYFAEHPVAMDWLVIVLLGVPGLVSAWFAANPWLSGALMLGGCAALYWRRRRPVAALVALAALALAAVAVAGDTSGFELGLAFGVYAVATDRSPRVAWSAVIGVNVGVFGALLLWGTWEPNGAVTPVIATSVGVLLLTLVAIAIGSSVRNRREHVQRLLDRANQFALERDQRERIATAAERTRIAREMHDVVAHGLSVMIALADGASASLARSPERSAAALTELATTGRNALADMRRILGVLRDGQVGSVFTAGAVTDGDVPLAPQPGGHDLGELIGTFRAAGLPVRLTVVGPAVPVDAGLELTIYRIVQEGLTNVLRHAPRAERIEVAVARADHTVTVTVTNDAGAGPLEAPVGSGQGLIGMRERAAVYGGTVEAGPGGSGWRLRVALRFEEKEEHA